MSFFQRKEIFRWSFALPRDYFGRMSIRRILGAGLAVTLSVAAQSPGHPAVAPTDASPDVAAEWRDHAGWVIKRLGRDGSLTLFDRDVDGRVVCIVRKAGRFSRADVERGMPGAVAWQHTFGYDAFGRLAAEEDCSGIAHPIPAGGTRAINLRRATTLDSHVHMHKRALAPGGKR